MSDIDKAMGLYEKLVDKKFHEVYYAAPPPCENGVMILAPTVHLAMEAASIMNFHPSERGVTVASYDNERIYRGNQPTVVVLVITTEHEISWRVRDMLINLLHRVARYPRGR